jgi:hypothetical protein
MSNLKHRLEFYPEIEFTIPKAPGVSCCLKPTTKQTKLSREIYRFAKHFEWQDKDELGCVIPSKSDSKVRAIMKWSKFKARFRMWGIGIRKLLALVIDEKVLCQGKLNLGEDFKLVE